LLCFLSFSLAGQAQVILKQSPASVTRAQTKTARMQCTAQGVDDFASANIHWYRHAPSRAPERILYIGAGQVSYDDSSYENKYSALKRDGNICIFSVNNINANDESVYYCAYW
ncbi:LV321 protein, partial [Urocolius indicus]|nr:LV321 protein [Urocolius indicus]NXX86127.1 LV321 protein [Urocolius indicus]NXX87482.1 LV321 protein [Urocolius indicus]